MQDLTPNSFRIPLVFWPEALIPRAQVAINLSSKQQYTFVERLWKTRDIIKSMNIFVDESGTFRTAANPDSWCVVVAYASPEIDRAPLNRLVRDLRLECTFGKEAKLSDIPERRYARFLYDLSHLRGIAFAVAIDAHLHTEEGLIKHRDGQAAKVVEHIDTMLYAEGRQSLQELSDAIRTLPVQLYTQLICQVELFHALLTRAITYYAQRQPATLRSLRWRVDRKDTIPTAYENAFRTILPVLLQTKSLKDPMLMLTEGADYSFFKRYEYASGKEPTYLKDLYGIDHKDGSVDIGKIVREDFQLVESSTVPGVQVADLLASGLRRTMRRNFDDPERIATLLGSNLLQEFHRKPPLRLFALGPGRDEQVSERTAHLLKAMTQFNKAFLTDRV